MHELIVVLEDNNKRMDNVTTKYMVTERPELEISRTLIQRMIEKGEVLLNKGFVKPGHKVKPDDRIEIDLEELEKVKVMSEIECSRCIKQTMIIIFSNRIIKM